MQQAPSPKVIILILNWNGKEDTLHCLASLQKLQTPNVEIIVIDNGSEDDSVSAIRMAYPQISLIETKKNLGFAGGNNRGIQEALQRKAEFICLLNNDTEVDPNCIDAFLALSKTYHHQAILGGKIYRFDDPKRFDHFGGNWNLEKGAFDLIGHHLLDDGHSWEQPFALDYVCACLCFIPSHIFQTVGLLDERYFLYWEECDFCFRAKKHGFSSIVCPKAYVWHKISAQAGKNPPLLHYYYWRNRFLWGSTHLNQKEKNYLHRRITSPAYRKHLKRSLTKRIEAFLFRNRLAINDLRESQAILSAFEDFKRNKFGKYEP